MKKADFPYTGFPTSWFFEDPKAMEYEQYFIDYIASPQIYEDLKQALVALKKYELLMPTYVRCHPQAKFEINADHIDDFITEVAELIKQGKIDTEIDIGGYGVVYDENNEPLIQEDLIGVAIRFFQRQVVISTTKGIWVPISIAKNHDLDWQIELARNNCYRLEACLREIHAALGMQMSPAEEEIDRDNSIWIKGFRPYINPSILISQYKHRPLSQPFNFSEFLLEQYPMRETNVLQSFGDIEWPITSTNSSTHN
jgi:hypothetical protein